MDYRILYSKCFNTITDEIQALEVRVKKLKRAQQELEEQYIYLSDEEQSKAEQDEQS